MARSREIVSHAAPNATRSLHRYPVRLSVAARMGAIIDVAEGEKEVVVGGKRRREDEEETGGHRRCSDRLAASGLAVEDADENEQEPDTDRLAIRQPFDTGAVEDAREAHESARDGRDREDPFMGSHRCNPAYCPDPGACGKQRCDYRLRTVGAGGSKLTEPDRT